MGKSLRIELQAAYYRQRARAYIRGRWTLIGVGYRLERSSSVIIEMIPRSSDLLAASHNYLGENLAPQAWQVFRSLDEVVQGLTRSLGLWIMSLGPLDRSAALLAGWVHLTGTSGTLVGGDPWVPMSIKPRSTCRHSG
jgi:hypothetical protein